ncbi:EscU/YscU/HrcU family type III secretion system export apparatus switch protein [Lederbergia citrea]|uniref:EscU/YscU/HrcU family type III secretion system export apparatus switch protein n=1 Tax=Lederbergia citrea TaxID=2833581 RepID=A0A942Z344_9BACI|nr:EscU/YscU/HrcU family type III secretion system export apparatus switch protein [Lederbergia citrea]MBS4178272.1 EscU/YscU/HrcU family type III secretion system export apparatus switch protein [Lederbergia citrea]MBS4204949.1 EscU/YscU/HrcU family type III secretion system export apparatus switch protein [Lederbergia citrea]MBS4223198.1 EscU/YscU/HrcU family type III secretion system export apparatus switch protein [Lederbergia citrea]
MIPNYYNQKNRRIKNGPSAAVLRYDEAGGGAPQVVAQGTGAVAVKIMDLAQQHGVQMQEDANLVSHLLDIDLGNNVPPQLYSVIAEILILLEEMDKNY